MTWEAHAEPEAREAELLAEYASASRSLTDQALNRLRGSKRVASRSSP